MINNQVRHINFLEQKPKGPPVSRSLNYFWILTILVCSALLAGGYSYYQMHRIKALKAEVEQLNLANERAHAESAQDTTKEDAKALKSLLNDPVLWSKLIRQIIKKVPDTVKLSEISGTTTDKRTLIIKGTSPFLLPILRLKDNFAKFKDCENASLTSVSKSFNENKQEQIAFQLECKLT